MTKYRAVKTRAGGIVFDSKLEAGVWLMLSLMEKAGKISGLKRQVPFVLVPEEGECR